MYKYITHFKFKTFCLDFFEIISDYFSFIFTYYTYKILVNFYRFIYTDDALFITKLGELEKISFFFERFELLYTSFYMNVNRNNAVEWCGYKVQWVNKKKFSYTDSTDFYEKYNKAAENLDNDYSPQNCLLLNFFFSKNNEYTAYIYIPFEFCFIILNLLILLDALNSYLGYKDLSIITTVLFKGPKNFRNRESGRYYNSSYKMFSKWFLDHYAIHNYRGVWISKNLKNVYLLDFKLFYF